MVVSSSNKKVKITTVHDKSSAKVKSTEEVVQNSNTKSKSQSKSDK
jgi:hypothetical protein